jgi:hypothetical protein
MPIDPRHDTEPRQRESSDDDVPWVTLGAKDNLNLRVEGSELHSNPAFTYQSRFPLSRQRSGATYKKGPANDRQPLFPFQF